MISLNNIEKSYSGFFALKNVNLEISKGEFVALTGYSGSGKSTLLNMMGLIDVPTSGEIFIKGLATAKMSDSHKAELRNKMFGFVFQAFYLESHYTVVKNVEIPLIIRGEKPVKRKGLIAEALETVGLKDKAKNLAGTLSGGEMQRAAIARAIVNNPEIILADEPCGNLDSKNSEIVLDVFKRLHDLGKTVVMVTHNPQHAKIAERIITLRDGEIFNDERTV